MLSAYIPYWDGESSSNAIIGILSTIAWSEQEDDVPTIDDLLDKVINSESTNLGSCSSSKELLFKWTFNYTSKYQNNTGNEQNFQTVTTLYRIFSKVEQHLVERFLSDIVKRSNISNLLMNLLNIYITAGKMLSEFDLAIPILPQPEIVYYCLFVDNAYFASQICEIVHVAKQLVPKYKIQLEIDQLNQLNSYIMDICNLFWRQRAFSLQERAAKGCGISE